MGCVTGLGQFDETTREEIQFWDVDGKLQQIRAQLDELQTATQADPGLSAAIGRDLGKAEQDYGAAYSRWQGVRAAVGLPTGLGVLVITAAAATAVVAVSAMVVALGYFLEQILSKAIAYRQNSSIRQQAAEEQRLADQARARGDTSGAQAHDRNAQSLLAQLGKQLESSIEAWLTKNYGVVAMGLGVFLLLSLAGGRRK